MTCFNNGLIQLYSYWLQIIKVQVKNAKLNTLTHADRFFSQIKASRLHCGKKVISSNIEAIPIDFIKAKCYYIMSYLES